MLRRFGVNFVILSLVMDAWLVWLALTLADRWRPDLSWLPLAQQFDPRGQAPLLLYLVAPLLWVAVLALFSLYDPRAIFRVSEELRILVVGSGFAALASAGLLYLTYRGVSRWLFLLFVGMAFVFLPAWRVAARWLAAVLKRPPGRTRRILILGTGPTGREIGRLIAAYQWTGLTLVGYLDADPNGESEGGPVLGSVADARGIVEAQAVDEVVVALPHGDPRLREVFNDLLDLPLHVRVVPDWFTLAVDRPTVEDFAGIPMVDLRAGPLSEYQRITKRIFDLLVGVALTPIALPIMAVIAVAIRADSPGPVLLRQPRVGENGKVFEMYKFRSMVRDAEELRASVTRRDEHGRVIHKQPDDPRVTRVGRSLRRASLDELPQLFNILKGDMSLVGPRPELPWLVAEYEPWQRRRLVVPQGLTGWWQVNGRSNKLMHLHTDDDLYYIANYSFWLDLRILWRTFWMVLLGEGAY